LVCLGSGNPFFTSPHRRSDFVVFGNKNRKRRLFPSPPSSPLRFSSMGLIGGQNFYNVWSPGKFVALNRLSEAQTAHFFRAYASVCGARFISLCFDASVAQCFLGFPFTPPNVLVCSSPFGIKNKPLSRFNLALLSAGLQVVSYFLLLFCPSTTYPSS